MRISSLKTNRGFVPIELLAIIGIVFLLAGVFLPSASRVKSRSASLTCMSNHRQIVHAWQLYAQDNSGQCANNFTIPGTYNTIISKEYENWANNVVTWTTSDIPNPNLASQYRIFRPYIGDHFEVYRCPSDNFLSGLQRQRGFKHRERSVSMNTLVGRYDTTPTSAQGRSWISGGQYRQWLKVRDIRSPNKTWVTIDEHPDSINDGVFVNEPNTSSWGDLPGTLHSRSTSFSFADGHVETRKWRSRRWMVPVKFNYSPQPTFDALSRQDFAWYVANSGFVRY